MGLTEKVEKVVKKKYRKGKRRNKKERKGKRRKRKTPKEKNVEIIKASFLIYDKCDVLLI